MNIKKLISITCVAGAMSLTPLASSAATNWQGSYFGANLGYGWGDADADDSATNTWNDPNDTINVEPEGFLGGIQLGRDWQRNNWVYGVVIDLDTADIQDTGTSKISSDTHAETDINWISTLRARLGYANNNNLFYVTAGVAVADMDVRAYDLLLVPGPGLMDVDNNGTESGWVAGVGFEHSVNAKWSWFAEALYMDFGKVTTDGPAITGGIADFEHDIDLTILKAGFNYRW